MSRRKEVTHCVPGGAGFRCLHCGEESNGGVAYPAPVNVWMAAVKTFTAGHRDCQPSERADLGEDSDQARAREEELARQARAAAPTPAEKRKRHVYRGTQACRNCGAAKGAEAPCPGKGVTT